ncbi:MAG: isoprenylcysteine carboxylmethyltransferase family protein [Croceitalea sp.]|nr:isoprenylcysteine carboxylmethyltransferase family protein [Croceitalea sp.]
MKLKLLPPLVMIIFGVAMYALDRYLPFGEFEFFGRGALVYVMMGLGFLCMVIALVQFASAKPTTNPLKPSKATVLVRSGIYQYTRNPMYLGMLLLLIAFALRLGNAFNTLLAAGFVYYMNHFQIKGEEEALTLKFGKEYKYYCKEVRRWF